MVDDGDDGVRRAPPASSGGGWPEEKEDDWRRRCCTLHFANWSAFVCLPRYLAGGLSSQSNSTTTYSKPLGSSSNLTYI
jgi:hypothetical protein